MQAKRPCQLKLTKPALLLTGAALVLQACSARDVFDIAQEHQRQDCEWQPIALQESCRAQYEMSYAEYERLRNQDGRTEKR